VVAGAGVWVVCAETNGAAMQSAIALVAPRRDFLMYVIECIQLSFKRVSPALHSTGIPNELPAAMSVPRLGWVTRTMVEGNQRGSYMDALIAEFVHASHLPFPVIAARMLFAAILGAASGNPRCCHMLRAGVAPPCRSSHARTDLHCRGLPSAFSRLRSFTRPW
jgi:hypothetical protein